MNMLVDNRILLASSGFFHPSWLARQRLKRNLQTLPGYVFQQVASLQVLPQLDIFSFRAIVLYFHHKAISPSALACLDEFVRRGGGVLAIHSATASFKQEPRYFEILGGRFRVHGAVQTFKVSPDPERGGCVWQRRAFSNQGRVVHPRSLRPRSRFILKRCTMANLCRSYGHAATARAASATRCRDTPPRV